MTEKVVEFVKAQMVEARRRLEEAKRELADARAREQLATTKEQLALKQIETYQGVLDIALGDASPHAEVVARDHHGNGSLTSEDEETDQAEDSNNADLVRQFFRDRGAKGVKPLDLSKHFAATKMTVHKNYGYSILARLKRRHEITVRSGRYFATQKLLDRLRPEEPISDSNETRLQFEEGVLTQ